MGISHNGKTFLAIFYSVRVSLCLSVWLGLRYWQQALNLVKLCQHLDSNHKPFSCLFCVGCDWRTNHSGPIWIWSLCWTTLYMQQYTIHINFQALPLSLQVQEQSKSKKEIALSTIWGRKADKENNWSVLPFLYIWSDFSYVTTFFFQQTLLFLVST